MNVVFVNSFELQLSENERRKAQVSIGEYQGKWQVLWTEQNEQGTTEQDHWFEGSRWDEMISTYRYRVTEKLGDGFKPLLGEYEDKLVSLQGRALISHQLQYYAEQHKDDEIYEQLRKWRRTKALKDGKPAYMIATNRVLQMVSAYVPQSNDQLMQIPGFGQQKIELYGKDILELTMHYEQKCTFPLDWVAEQVDFEALRAWHYKQKEAKLKFEWENQQLKKEILKAAAVGLNLEQMREHFKLSERDMIGWLEKLDREGYDMDQLIVKEVESIPSTERDKAMDAFQQEGDRYLKPILKKLYTEEQQEKLDLNSTYTNLRLLRILYRKNSNVSVSAQA
jgi:hypothetical protein